MKFLVVVPKPGSPAGKTIDAGSGVVCWPEAQGERAEVYFEGNRYNSWGLEKFDARVQLAAGRLSKRYPTIARGLFPMSDFFVVGAYDYEAHVLEIDEDKQTVLDAWLSSEPTKEER